MIINNNRLTISNNQLLINIDQLAISNNQLFMTTSGITGQLLTEGDGNCASKNRSLTPLKWTITCFWLQPAGTVLFSSHTTCVIPVFTAEHFSRNYFELECCAFARNKSDGPNDLFRTPPRIGLFWRPLGRNAREVSCNTLLYPSGTLAIHHNLIVAFSYLSSELVCTF